jgi:rhomboid family GlyGly-CTERM serine protease
MRLMRSARSRAAGVLCRLPWLSVAVSLFSCFLAFSSGLSARLSLLPGAVYQGEIWRLWTGHLTHFGRAHAVGDIAAFAVWAAALELGWNRRMLAQSLLGAGLLVAALVLATSPSAIEYRGLSAIDCALVAELITLGVADARQRRRPVLLFALTLWAAGLVAKTVFELLQGHAVLAPDLGHGVALLPTAHIFGITAGIVLGAWYASSARPVLGVRW